VSAVQNSLALVTLRWVRHGHAQWELCHVMEHGYTYETEPQPGDYAGFARFDLMMVPGVLDATIRPDSLRVVFDPYLVGQVPRTWDTDRATQMATCRLLGIAARHGFELAAELET
jgi:hypothetical protein